MNKLECQTIEFLEEHLKDPRAAKIIAMRRGWGDYKKHTYREIGEAVGVTGGRIAQIHNKTFRILRHPSRVELMTPSVRSLLWEDEVRWLPDKCRQRPRWMLY